MLADGSNSGILLSFSSSFGEITLSKLAEQILQTPPEQGYLTISNALQWRLQYQRIVALVDDIPGISKIVSYNKPK